MNDSLIGKSIERIDVKDKVTGKALYPGDFSRPDQVYMKVVFAEKAHAIIKSIDISEAEALSGVIMILTAKDVPSQLVWFDETGPTCLVRTGIGCAVCRAGTIRRRSGCACDR